MLHLGDVSADPLGLLGAVGRQLTGDCRVLTFEVGGSTPAGQQSGELGAALALLAVPSVVSIAGLRGGVAGPAAVLALGCDLAVWSEQATLSVPEPAQGGLPAAGLLEALASAVGRPRTMALLVGACTLTADEARHAGLATAVVPGDALHAELRRLTARVLSCPRDPLAEAKSIVLGHRPPPALDGEQAAAGRLQRATATAERMRSLGLELS